MAEARGVARTFGLSRRQPIATSNLRERVPPPLAAENSVTISSKCRKALRAVCVSRDSAWRQASEVVRQAVAAFLAASAGMVRQRPIRRAIHLEFAFDRPLQLTQA